MANAPTALAPAHGSRQPSPAGAALAPRAGWERLYFEATTALRLGGPIEEARGSLLSIVDGAAVQEPSTAARAALRLAELEAQAGHRRRAAELLARARSLGRGRPPLLERADALEGDLAVMPGARSEVRGPPVGIPLDQATPAAAEAFAGAERLLAAYHERTLAPRLEALRAAIRAKDLSLDQAARAYREAIGLGDPVVATAAEFRIGSLHHDMALALSFDLPPELDSAAAAKTRKSLRSRALAELRKAEAAYRRCLESTSSAETFSHAASRELRAVEDLLSALE